MPLGFLFWSVLENCAVDLEPVLVFQYDRVRADVGDGSRGTFGMEQGARLLFYGSSAERELSVRAGLVFVDDKTHD